MAEAARTARGSVGREADPLRIRGSVKDSLAGARPTDADRVREVPGDGRTAHADSTRPKTKKLAIAQ
jgi:hypothetical protein